MLLFITVDRPVNPSSISKVDPDDGVISLLPPVPGEEVNAFKLNPYWGYVLAVPTVLKPARVLSCQYFNTPVVWS